MVKKIIFCWLFFTMFACDQVRTEYTYYDNGAPKTKYVLLNGKLHGEIERYYPDGKVKDIQRFKDGTREGYSESYTEEGKLIKRDLYIENELIEVEFFWTDQKGYVKGRSSIQRVLLPMLMSIRKTVKGTRFHFLSFI